jgi:hypothetical protein
LPAERRQDFVEATAIAVVIPLTKENRRVQQATVKDRVR